MLGEQFERDALAEALVHVGHCAAQGLVALDGGGQVGGRLPGGLWWEVVEEGGDDAQQPGLPGGLTSGSGAVAGEHHSCQQRAQSREAGLVAGAPGGKATEAGDRAVPREAGQVDGVDVQQQYGRVRLRGESGGPSLELMTTRMSGAGYQL